MAREIEQIKEEMTARFMQNQTAAERYGFTPGDAFAAHFSRVSVESILFYVFAASAWILENLFDLHKKEVADIIANQKTPTLRWYAGIAKDFLYGVALPADSDRYDLSQLSAEQIAAAKIISNAAVIDMGDSIRIKVAKEAGNNLVPLSDVELSAFAYYMQRVSPAGVPRSITSSTGDQLTLSLKIYYDPLVLDADGKTADGKEPVRDAVKEYMKMLPFNGMLVMAYLIDHVQKVVGVVAPHVVSASAQYGATTTPITVMYLPDAGYLSFANKSALTIIYEPQPAIL